MSIRRCIRYPRFGGNRQRAIPALLCSTLLLTTIPWTQVEAEVIGLPETDLFEPLVADPKEPRFVVSFLNAEGMLYDTTVAAVGFGEYFGLARWPGATAEEGWQINISGAVFSQFDLNAPSADLINADYLIGVPVTYRQGSFSSRIRIYHQSSHLGDEFLLREQPDRVNLSYESIELLASYDVGTWRVYGGGEYLYHREPEDLKPGVLHAGVEYRHPRRIFQIGNIGMVHFLTGLDVKSFEQQNWDGATSVKAGFEFRPARDTVRDGRYWRLLAEYYDGPSPYGQFFNEDIRYWGVGIALSL